MKIGKVNNWNPRNCAGLALTALALAAAPIATNAATNGFVAPHFRGMANTEYGYWETFTVPVGAPGNLPDQPGSTTGALVTQTNAGAFLAGDNIYSTGISSFTLDDAVPYTLATVVLQMRTLGNELNYNTVSLIYSNDTGIHTLAPLFRYEYNRVSGMGYAISSLWQWDLASLGISNYTIAFSGNGGSVSLDSIMLDTAATNTLGANFVDYTTFLQQPFKLQSQQPAITRWNYLASDFSSGTRGTASAFGALGDPGFDARDAQYLIGWNTTNRVPSGQGAKNYVIRRARVTLTIATGGQYVYTGTLRDYRSYYPTNDSRYVAAPTTNYPVELFGAGFRGSYTNEAEVVIPWASTNYPQTGPWAAGPSDVYYTNRVAYAAGFDTNGVLVDVSNNVGDNNTEYVTTPYEVAPFAVGQSTNVTEGQLMPTGSQLTFDINLDDPLIYGYLQRGLNEGNLSFMASCFVASSIPPAPAKFPAFYTLFSGIATAAQHPLLDLEGEIVRANVDGDNDGLSDDWENFYFGNLLSTATGDTDGDTVNNLGEYRAGTIPSASTNLFKVLSADHKTNISELHFTFAPGRAYSIRWSTDLANWQTVTNPVLTYSSPWLAKSGTNLTYPSPVYAVWRDTNATNAVRFYRPATQ